MNALENYAEDADVELFMDILFDEIGDQHYYDQMTMIAHLKKALMQMDVLDQKRVRAPAVQYSCKKLPFDTANCPCSQDGHIYKGVFFQGLRLFFPIKSEKNHQTLESIVTSQMMTLNPETHIMQVLPSTLPSHLSRSAFLSQDPHPLLQVDTNKILQETDDGDQSDFMEVNAKTLRPPSFFFKEIRPLVPVFTTAPTS